MVAISFKKFYTRFLYVTGLYLCDPWEQMMCFTLIFGFIFTLLMSALVFLPSHAMAFYSYVRSRRSPHSLANEM
ncbi:unnamed protein product [Hymenolepis diminuta]|uniref:Uncharacterized protein n=1 Tax=Hymenolepis diminuta TaxID=6216 RepID=A0A564YII1_HYMDI|nr:unnamed protein product [Hymenolepis diminuta]